MKAYLIGGSYESCHYVRCMLPAQANGWDSDKMFLNKPRVGPERMFEGAKSADIVVFHRPIDPKMYDAARLLKLTGKKIVMDNDDTYIKDSGVPLNMFKFKEQLVDAVQVIDDRLKKFAEMADLVTVSTDLLAKEYSEFAKVAVLPNCVDPFDWPKPKEKGKGKVRIGLCGSVASNRDYQSIIPLLDWMKEREDVQLVLFALPIRHETTKLAQEIYEDEYKFWFQYNPEWQPFVNIADYSKTLSNLNLDIALIPRFDSYFNRAKSNVKFLEMSMCKTATIAQSFSTHDSPYEMNEEDTKHLLLANTPEEWIEAVKTLIEDPEKRKNLGESAHQYVLKNYNIHEKAHLWKQAYQAI
jgi:glycosyltransferase involved in cell wall biosynthesis